MGWKQPFESFLKNILSSGFRGKHQNLYLSNRTELR